MDNFQFEIVQGTHLKSRGNRVVGHPAYNLHIRHVFSQNWKKTCIFHIADMLNIWTMHVSFYCRLLSFISRSCINWKLIFHSNFPVTISYFHGNFCEQRRRLHCYVAMFILDDKFMHNAFYYVVR